MPIRIALICALLPFCFSASASADLLIGFSNGDMFDGDGATAQSDSTDQAGPFNLSATIQGTLTTRLINGQTSTTASNILETNDFKLGIDTASEAGGEKNNWDDGESWTFDWDIATLFSGVDFGGFEPGDVFTVQSNSFIGFTPQGALGTGVSFSAGSGTFTFDGSASNDNFVLADLGGQAAEIAAGDDITITFSGDQASLQSFTFGAASAVPEPMQAGILFISALLCFRRRK